MARLRNVPRRRRSTGSCEKEWRVGLKRPSRDSQPDCDCGCTRVIGIPGFNKCSSTVTLEGCKKENPSRDAAWRYAEAAKLASPLRTFEGAQITPPHGTGGAVDIEITDEAGNPLDFGMEVKDWDVVPPELCATEFDDLPDAAAGNRKLLVETLVGEGFVNYPREWWHFSFGDQYWAFVTASTRAPYGAVYEPTVRGEGR